jgi:para-aminobenzoate synthetase component 1
LAWYRAFLKEAGQVVWETGRQGEPLDYSPIVSADRLSPQFRVPGHERLMSSFSAAGYRHAVGQVIDFIHAGDVFQVNLSQRLLHPAESSPVELYCRLRERNPAPFAAYFNGGPWQVASASPERFLQARDGRVETRPIKGTRPRAIGKPEFDQQIAMGLLASSKDRAENVMIVDLLRNDLSRVCESDSVRVSQLCGLESYAAVHHLVSVVEGQLCENRTTIDLLRSCLPGGSVTGAPKIRAMEIISELEPTVRGAYCGALGYLSASGAFDSSILIRTITAGRGWWQFPVGGGVVAQSDPEDEYAETWHKASAMLGALYH